MNRVDQLTEKLKRWLEISDERDLTVDEELDLLYDQQDLSEQLEANKRQAVTAVARQTLQAAKAVKQSRWYHIRLSVTGKLNFNNLAKVMLRIAQSSYRDSAHSFVYVIEQSGCDEESRGNNPHVHIRLRSTLTDGRLKAKISRATGLDAPAVFVVQHHNVNALRQYMAGHKGDDAKVVKCQQDVIWRLEHDFKDEYVL